MLITACSGSCSSILFHSIRKSFTHPAVLPAQPPTFSPSTVTRPSPLPLSSSHPRAARQELPSTWSLHITGPLSPMISFQGLGPVPVPGVAVTAHLSPPAQTGLVFHRLETWCHRWHLRPGEKMSQYRWSNSLLSANTAHYLDPMVEQSLLLQIVSFV